MTVRWRIAGDHELYRKSWDGETILYDDTSGETRQLDPLASEVLELFERGAASESEMTEAVATSLGLENDLSLQLAVTTAMSWLRGAGLIEESRP